MPLDTRWPSVESTAEPLTANRTSLGARLWITLGATVLFVALTTGLITTYVIAAGAPDTEPPAGVIYGAAGVALLAAIGLLWWRFDESERRAAFPLHRPCRAEVAWALCFVPLGVAAFLAGEWIAGRLGFELPAFYTYDLGDPVTAAGVLFGAVLVAPLVEELLFRGALLGALVERGWSTVAAGVGSIVVFAGYHVFALGVAGVFAIAAWATLPTMLRLRFDNLAGAWLLHLCNNVYAYVILVFLVS